MKPVTGRLEAVHQLRNVAIVREQVWRDSWVRSLSVDALAMQFGCRNLGSTLMIETT